MSESLNRLLPTDLFALNERNMNQGLRRTLAVRRTSDQRVVANIEIFSTGNQLDANGVREFVEKVGQAIRNKIHVVVIDLFPPGKYDPRGLVRTIFRDLGLSDPEGLPDDMPLNQVSLCAEPEVTAYLEPLKIGDAFPDLPLFFRPDRYICLPLESTYSTAFEAMPKRFRKVLEE